MSLHTELSRIQKELKAPKNQFNAFGKYKYRSCEDILEGLKSVIGENVVTVSDSVEMVGERIYIKATATITDGKDTVSVEAYARESLTKKGMDDSQITGTASSYARKYALNGLFLIDDQKDADSMDNSQPQAQQQQEDTEKGWYNDFDKHKTMMISQIAEGKSADQIIKNLRNTFKVSTKVADLIKGLEK